MTSGDIIDGKLWCTHCRKYTDQVNNNVVFCKTTRNIQLKIMCANCSRPKSKYISNKVLNQFPEIKMFLDTLTPKQKVSEKNIKDKEGGILPLLPLLGAIFGGITAAAGASTAVAVPVLNKQKADAELEEQKRHNLEVEKLARGEAIRLPRGEAIENPEDPDTLKEMIQSAKEFLAGNGYTIFKDDDNTSLQNYLSGKGYELF